MTSPPAFTRASAFSRATARLRVAPPAWLLIARQDCRDIWIRGRGIGLLFIFSLLLSGVSYLAATNQVLNFLEQRESVNLTLQVSMAVGCLVSLVVGADAISGERERGTLEALLLTPVSRRAIVVGKAAAALSLWVACWVVSLPYLWVLGRGVAVVGESFLLGLLGGTLLALALTSAGLLISALSNSNRISVSVSIFVLIALSAPTQLPTGLASTRLGDVLVRINPVGSTLHYVSSVLVRDRGWTRDLSYLAAPPVTALLCGGTLLYLAPALVRLSGGGGPR